MNKIPLAASKTTKGGQNYKTEGNNERFSLFISLNLLNLELIPWSWKLEKQNFKNEKKFMGQIFKPKGEIIYYTMATSI